MMMKITIVMDHDDACGDDNDDYIDYEYMVSPTVNPRL